VERLGVDGTWREKPRRASHRRANYSQSLHRHSWCSNKSSGDVVTKGQDRLLHRQVGETLKAPLDQERDRKILGQPVIRYSRRRQATGRPHGSERKGITRVYLLVSRGRRGVDRPRRPSSRSVREERRCSCSFNLRGWEGPRSFREGFVMGEKPGRNRNAWVAAAIIVHA